MALTLNTYPANISNSGAFNITTSLSEDSTHVNLRVRADIYHEGIIKAVVEKPKGIADFDFSDILKTLLPGLMFARDLGETTISGTIGSNLINDWSIYSGSFDVFTHSAETITQAQNTSVNPGFLKTNNITVAVGDLYLLYSPDKADVGVNPAHFYMQGTSFLNVYNTVPYAKNKSILIMPIAGGTLNVILGTWDGKLDVSGTFGLYKITTNRTTIGNPLTPYIINFTEVYEDAVGATQIGASIATEVMRYVFAKGDGINFAEYVLHDSTSLFANKTLRNNVTKFYKSIPYELWLNFFTEFVSLELFYSVDGGSWIHTIHAIAYEGWMSVILNIGELMNGVNSNLRVQIKNLMTGTELSEIITIYVDGSDIDERVVLEYDGLVGGKEYLAFEGLKDIQFTTLRAYQTGGNKNRKPLDFTGINRQKLETRFKDINNADYLKSLLISETVKKLEASYAAPTDVTVLTESVKISNSDMFTNQIDIEYEY